MPGYEDLTPDQLIYIMYLVIIAISIYSFTLLIRSFITLAISKNVKHLELMIEKKYDEGLNKKPSLFETLKLWWVERKNRKVQELPYKIPKKFK